MRPLLERLGGFLPAAVALALPTVFIPIAVDSYILPRAAIVIAGAGLGVGLALLLPGGPGLGPMRIPLIAAPIAVPTIASSLIGVFNTRFGNSLAKPLVALNAPPKVPPTSCP